MGLGDAAELTLVVNARIHGFLDNADAHTGRGRVARHYVPGSTAPTNYSSDGGTTNSKPSGTQPFPVHELWTTSNPKLRRRSEGLARADESALTQRPP